MEQLLKTWNDLGDENQLLLKRGLFFGVLLYIVLLAIHDLLPYALVGAAALFLYKRINKM